MDLLPNIFILDLMKPRQDAILEDKRQLFHVYSCEVLRDPFEVLEGRKEDKNASWALPVSLKHVVRHRNHF